MPAVSIKQRRAMAIAEHNPGELNKKNKGLLRMSHSQLHDFAATSEKKLPVFKRLAKR
jgi:hypothetical protein